MVLNVPRLMYLNGRQPGYDNSGNYYDVYGNVENYYPEIQPFRGFTGTFAQCRVYGKAILSDPSGVGGITGPSEGSLMLMFLLTRGGWLSQIGDWYQVGWSSGILTEQSTPIAGLGGWTKFVTVDHGGNGPKILGYWKVATAAEESGGTLWRIRTATSGQVFSQVMTVNFTDQWWREPFSPVINSRTVVNSASFAVPGVTTPSNPDVDLSAYGVAGGNFILNVNALSGQYSTSTLPNGGVSLEPGKVATEQYGGFYYAAYGAPYAWTWSLAHSFAIGDNTTVPDGMMNIQAPGRSPLHYAGLTMAIPSAPNVQLPTATDPVGDFTNSFETDNLSSFFTVSGTGTPTIS